MDLAGLPRPCTKGQKRTPSVQAAHRLLDGLLCGFFMACLLGATADTTTETATAMLLLELAPLRHEWVVSSCPVWRIVLFQVPVCCRSGWQPRVNGNRVRWHACVATTAHASASKARTAPATVSKCGCIMRCMARAWFLAGQAVTVSYGRCAYGHTDTKWEGDASKLASPDTGLKRVCWRQEGCCQQNLVVCGEAGKLCQ